MQIRIAGTVNDSVVDGPGLRYTVFFQGCSHGCSGCQNPQTWNPLGGYFVKTEDMVKEIVDNTLLSGVTLSGGDPMDRPYEARVLVEEIKKVRPELDIWCYTGCIYEQIIEAWREASRRREIDKNGIGIDIQRYRLLQTIDVLVDGPYVENQRDLTLQFRGSLNQRIINVPMSLKTGKVMLVPEYQEDCV